MAKVMELTEANQKLKSDLEGFKVEKEALVQREDANAKSSEQLQKEQKELEDWEPSFSMELSLMPRPWGARPALNRNTSVEQACTIPPTQFSHE